MVGWPRCSSREPTTPTAPWRPRERLCLPRHRHGDAGERLRDHGVAPGAVARRPLLLRRQMGKGSASSATATTVGAPRRPVSVTRDMRLGTRTSTRAAPPHGPRARTGTGDEYATDASDGSRGGCRCRRGSREQRVPPRLCEHRAPLMRAVGTVPSASRPSAPGTSPNARRPGVAGPRGAMATHTGPFTRSLSGGGPSRPVNSRPTTHHPLPTTAVRITHRASPSAQCVCSSRAAAPPSARAGRWRRCRCGPARSARGR